MNHRSQMLQKVLTRSSGSAGAKPVRNPEREKPKWEDTITNRMLHWSYTPEQKEEVKKALAAGVPKATILNFPSYSSTSPKSAGVVVISLTPVTNDSFPLCCSRLTSS